MPFPEGAVSPLGEKHAVTQTERIGRFIDGTVKVIEGRGYDAEEVGDRIAPGKDPVRFFEMNLKRVGDTGWPSAGVVGPN